MQKLGLFFLSIAVTLALSSMALALSNGQLVPLLWQSGGAAHDGVSLNFVSNTACVKSPGQAANCGAFGNLFTYARNSTATYRAQSGLLVYANENTTQFSQAFDNAAWAKAGMLAFGGGSVADAIAAPDNTITADLLTPSTSNTQHYVQATVAVGGGGAPLKSTVSIYCKANGYRWLRMALDTIIASIDCQGGVVGATSGVDSSGVVALPNGWFRFWATGTSPTINQSAFVSINNADSTSTLVYAGDGTSGVYLWSSQTQRGLSVGDYLITAAASKFDQPRIEYDASLNALGLFMEGARTTRARNSEDLSGAAWTVNNLTVAANSVASPDGPIGGDKLAEDNTLNAHRIFNSGPTSAGNTDIPISTASVFLKASERSSAFLTIASASLGMSVNFVYAQVNLSTCAISGSAAVGLATLSSSSASPYANGWCRVVLTGAAGTVADTPLVYVSIGDGVISNPTTAYTGVTGNGIYVWGLQYEDSVLFASSYIPSNAASVTRAVDTATLNVGGWYNTAEGTLVGTWRTTNGLAGQFATVCVIDDGGTNNRNAIFRNNSSTNAGLTITGGASQANIAGGTIGTSQVKSAYAYKAADFEYYSDGVFIGAVTSGTTPVVTVMRLGTPSYGTDNLYGWIKSLDYYPVRQPAAFLKARSTPGPQSMLIPANDNERRAYG